MNRIVLVVAMAASSTALAADWGKASDPEACKPVSSYNVAAYPKCKESVDPMVEKCLADPEFKKRLEGGGWVDGKNVSKLERDKGKRIPEIAYETCAEEALKRIEKQGKDDKLAADVANTEIPKPRWKNPAVEKLIAAAFKRDWSEDGQKLVLVVLDDEKWDIQRNGLGVITGRAMGATAVFRQGDKCKIHQGIWIQPHNGKTFAGALAEDGTGVEKELVCTKVK
jgi:hypothetical protein